MVNEGRPAWGCLHGLRHCVVGLSNDLCSLSADVESLSPQFLDLRRARRGFPVLSKSALARRERAMRRILAMAVAMILLSWPVEAGSESAAAAYDAGEYGAAYRELVPLAGKGDPGA